jgi:hypothetical protein
MLLYGSECWTLTKEQIRTEAAEMPFVRDIAGYRIMDHNRNEDTYEELKVINTSTIIKRTTDISG